MWLILWSSEKHKCPILTIGIRSTKQSYRRYGWIHRTILFTVGQYFTDGCPKANKRLLRRSLRECLGWQCKFIVRCVNVEWSDRSIRSIGQTFSRSDNYFTDGKKGRQRNKYMFYIPLFFTIIFVFKNIILHAKQA